jgi:two-component system sensor histidine kinase VanS
LEKETLDLSYMLTQMVDEFYPLLQNHGNTISLNIPEDLKVNADPVKLARVFNNILKNAIAYSYPDSLIEISASIYPESIRITFTNAGNTIPKQKLDTIFEKFYRMDDARSSNTGGAGLGLAIAKEIVLRHGGTITAQSEDHVTSFTVELPS